MNTSTNHRRSTDDVVSKILGAKSMDEIVGALDFLSADLGFRRFRADYLPSRAVAENSRALTFTNNPDQWERLLESIPNTVAGADPVWNHLSRSSLPLVWGQQTYHHAHLHEFYESFSAYGLMSGACLSLRGPKGELLALGFSTDAPSRNLSAHPELFGALYLASATILERASTLLIDNLEAQYQSRPLTPRELEVIKWSAAGKTRWEVGQILGISEPTVKFHLSNACEKLGAVNKQHAVVRAFHLQLI